jgi:hypothetical protein
MLKRASDLRNSDFGRKAIGFWMEVDGAEPVQPVRVLVTYEALWQIDPSQMHDLQAAFAIFDKHRSDIEAAASVKYDSAAPAVDTYEGQPMIILRADDLT